MICKICAHGCSDSPDFPFDGCIFKLIPTKWIREKWYKNYFSCEWEKIETNKYKCKLCNQLVDNPKNKKPWEEPCQHKW